MVHIAGKANTVTNAISMLDIHATCNVSEEILKDQDKNAFYIHYEHEHLTRVFSQLFIENIDLATSVGESFANISETKGDIVSLQ